MGRAFGSCRGERAASGRSGSCRECKYPRILERRNFFRWGDGAQEVLRAIERWAIDLHPVPRERRFAPAPLPWFEGREEDLGALWETLVDRAGTAVLVNAEPASGKSAMAQEFCRQASEHFRRLIWVACGERSLASIAADLAGQIGEDCPREEEGALERLLETAGRHRSLVVFDDFPPHLPIPAGSHERASVLATAREAQAPQGACVMRISKARDLRIPAPDNPADLRLLRAMAVCHMGGFPFDLAARISELDPDEAADARMRLLENRLADPFDDAAGRLRLNAVSAAMAGQDLEIERRRHAGLIHQAFSGWMKNQDFDRHFTIELTPAFRWAAKADWPLAVSIVRLVFRFLRHHGRITEGSELLSALRAEADARGDQAVSDECSRELSWIIGTPYSGLGRVPESGDQLQFDFGG